MVMMVKKKRLEGGRSVDTRRFDIQDRSVEDSASCRTLDTLPCRIDKWTRSSSSFLHENANNSSRETRFRPSQGPMLRSRAQRASTHLVEARVHAAGEVLEAGVLEVRQEELRLVALALAVLHRPPTQGLVQLHGLVRRHARLVLDKVGSGSGEKTKKKEKRIQIWGANQRHPPFGLSRLGEMG